MKFYLFILFLFNPHMDDGFFFKKNIYILTIFKQDKNYFGPLNAFFKIF